MYSFELMKNLIAIIIIIITGHFLPWWFLSIISLIIGFYSKKEFHSIINGFTIGFLSWFFVLIYKYYNGGNILFKKMSLLMNIDNPITLIIFSSILAGLLGLVSSWTGWQFRKK